MEQWSNYFMPEYLGVWIDSEEVKFQEQYPAYFGAAVIGEEGNNCERRLNMC